MDNTTPKSEATTATRDHQAEALAKALAVYEAGSGHTLTPAEADDLAFWLARFMRRELGCHTHITTASDVLACGIDGAETLTADEVDDVLRYMEKSESVGQAASETLDHFVDEVLRDRKGGSR